MRYCLCSCFVIIALLFNTYNLYADSYSIQDRKIDKIHTYANFVTFQYLPESTDENGCPDARTDTVTIDLTADNAANLYSIALSAFMAGKTVGFGVNDCVPAWGGQSPLVYRVDVMD